MLLSILLRLRIFCHIYGSYITFECLSFSWNEDDTILSMTLVDGREHNMNVINSWDARFPTQDLIDVVVVPEPLSLVVFLVLG